VILARGGRFAEGYCCANDYEQSQGRVFQAAGASICVSASECSQVPADFPLAAGKVVTIPNGTRGGTRGTVMTVTYEPPRLNRIGSLHALTLTRREGSIADVGSSQAAYGNLICNAP